MRLAEIAEKVGSDQHTRTFALVSDAFGGYGGIAQYNRDFLSALAESRHVQSVLVLPRTGVASDNGLSPKIIQLSPPSGRLLYVAKALHAMRAHGPFDLIFCGHIHLAPLASLVSSAARVPLWIQVHGIEAWWDSGVAIRHALERAHLVTSVSRYTQRRLLEWADVPRHRLKVLPNTVRPEFRQPLREEDINSTLLRHGLFGREVILTVGRINAADAYKGHHRVIRALKDIRNRFPKAIYAVVGQGDNRGELERIAVEEGVSDIVRFLGCLPDEETRALYHGACVFAMPSTKEGFGIVFLEAAACGLPVIAGNKDGSADALAEGELGSLVDPDNHDALVAAICDALQQRRAETPAAALERFDVRNFNAQVDALVRSLH